MKKLGVILGWVGSLGVAFSASADTFPRTTWVWESITFNMLDDLTFRGKVFEAIDRHNFGTVYLYADEFQGRNVLLEEPEKYHDLVSQLHARGVEVQALIGSAALNTEADILPSNRPAAEARLQRILDYNAAVTSADQRFVGVNTDIEPYLLSDFFDQYEVRAVQYLDLLAEYMRRKDEAGSDIPIGPAIPRWYDTSPDTPPIEWNGVTKGLHEHVIDITDYVSILDYVDDSVRLVDDARNELDYADPLGKPVVIGVETLPIQPGILPTTTFHDDGYEEMNLRLAVAEQDFLAWSNFAGFAIHDLHNCLTWCPEPTSAVLLSVFGAVMMPRRRLA